MRQEMKDDLVQTDSEQSEVPSGHQIAELIDRLQTEFDRNAQYGINPYATIKQEDIGLAIAALRALAWQPISTAPKNDYEEILVLVNAYDDEGLTHRIAMWDPEGDGISWNVFMANWDAQPVYWMHLPASPQTSSEERSDTTIPLRDGAIYTPTELAIFAKCSASYVREEIKRGNLKAFRFGERMIRIKGIEARQWIGKFADTSSGSSKDATAPSGMRMANAGDTAFLSVLRDQNRKA
jgi:hypothetical protein